MTKDKHRETCGIALNNSVEEFWGRQGSTVRSVYVGRGEIADMLSKFQSSSTDLEKLMRAKRLIEADKTDHVETTLDRAIELTELFTQATLLVAGFTLTTGNGDVNGNDRGF